MFGTVELPIRHQDNVSLTTTSFNQWSLPPVGLKFERLNNKLLFYQ